MTPPSFEEIARYILLERGSFSWLDVTESTDNGQPCWEMYNLSTDNLEVWVARQSVELSDIEAVRQIAQRLTDEMNANPVSTVSGVDVPTFGELYDLRYIGVIVTCTEPEPDVLAAAEASPDVYVLILSQYQIRNAELEIKLLNELEATRE